MKRHILLATTVALASLLASSAWAQDSDPVIPEEGNGNGVCRFIDLDGDGFNDLAPDADGDGIPNGLDSDYVRPEDGTGNQNQNLERLGFLFDVFGRGFGVLPLSGGQGQLMFGPNDGTGAHFGPADGTGFGPGAGDNPGDGVGTGSGQDRRGGQR